ncbi:hypothetical protein AAMO2058_001448300 [Amorphochlora amoebiformis]
MYISNPHSPCRSFPQYLNNESKPKRSKRKNMKKKNRGRYENLMKEKVKSGRKRKENCVPSIGF